MLIRGNINDQVRGGVAINSRSQRAKRKIRSRGREAKLEDALMLFRSVFVMMRMMMFFGHNNHPFPKCHGYGSILESAPVFKF